MLWTDEAHFYGFYPHGQVSSQNCVIWSKENPQAFTTAPLHSPKMMEWCGLRPRASCRHFSFPQLCLELNKYLAMIQSHLKPHLPRERKNITFQQDKPPYIVNPVKGFLNETFGDRVITVAIFLVSGPHDHQI